MPVLDNEVRRRNLHRVALASIPHLTGTGVVEFVVLSWFYTYLISLFIDFVGLHLPLGRSNKNNKKDLVRGVVFFCVTCPDE